MTYAIPNRSDRRWFPYTETARRLREQKRNRTFEPVAIPGRTRRPITLGQLGFAALRALACAAGFTLVFVTMVGWAAMLWGA